MSTSATYTFSPEVAQLVEEAAERCGISPASLQTEHLQSMRRSLNFMFAAWSTKGFKQPWITTYSVTLAPGQITVPLVVPAIDVFHAYLTRSAVDTEMYPISRQEYEQIPVKTDQGRPTQYWVNANTSNNNGAPTVYLWQTSNLSTDIANFSVLNRAQDAGQANNTTFIPYLWFEACAAGLAARFSQKWRPERYQALLGEAGMVFKEAMTSTREKGPTRIRHRGF